MRCRNAERRIRAAHGVHGKGIFGLSLTLRPEGLPAVNVANKMGFPSIWKRPNLWLFQQHVEVSTRTAAFVCFLIAFAQDSLLFPAGLKGLPIHRTIVINIPIIYKDPHCGMDYHTPQNIPVLRCYHVSTMAHIGFSPLWDLPQRIFRTASRIQATGGCPENVACMMSKWKESVSTAPSLQEQVLYHWIAILSSTKWCRNSSIALIALPRILTTFQKWPACQGPRIRVYPKTDRPSEWSRMVIFSVVTIFVLRMYAEAAWSNDPNINSKTIWKLEQTLDYFTKIIIYILTSQLFAYFTTWLTLFLNQEWRPPHLCQKPSEAIPRPGRKGQGHRSGGIRQLYYGYI